MVSSCDGRRRFWIPVPKLRQSFSKTEGEKLSTCWTFGLSRRTLLPSRFWGLQHDDRLARARWNVVSACCKGIAAVIFRLGGCGRPEKDSIPTTRILQTVLHGTLSDSKLPQCRARQTGRAVDHVDVTKRSNALRNHGPVYSRALNSSMLQSYPQRRLVPNYVFPLVLPVSTLLIKLQIEVPKHACHDGAKFVIGQAAPIVSELYCVPRTASRRLTFSQHNLLDRGGKVARQL